MANRTSKGQVFTFIILLLIGIIVAFAVVSARLARVRHVPIVQEVFWYVDGQSVTTSKVGSEVKVHATVKATEEYVGSVVVKIRKDVVLWPDSNYQVLTVPVNLEGGQEKEMELAFVPDESSGGRLRGYFIEVDFTATDTKWVMEDSYPPRLKVV